MPSKSRRKKSRYTGQRKVQTPGKARPVSQPPAEAEAEAPTTQSIRPRVTDSKASAQVASIASLSNVRRELKTIGILAGALLIILIVLAIVLH